MQSQNAELPGLRAGVRQARFSPARVAQTSKSAVSPASSRPAQTARPACQDCGAQVGKPATRQAGKPALRGRRPGNRRRGAALCRDAAPAGGRAQARLECPPGGTASNPPRHHVTPYEPTDRCPRAGAFGLGAGLRLPCRARSRAPAAHRHARGGGNTCPAQARPPAAAGGPGGICRAQRNRGPRGDLEDLVWRGAGGAG